MYSREQKQIQRIANSGELNDYTRQDLAVTLSYVGDTFQNIFEGKDNVSVETLSALKKIMGFCCDRLLSYSSSASE